MVFGVNHNQAPPGIMSFVRASIVECFYLSVLQKGTINTFLPNNESYGKYQ